MAEPLILVIEDDRGIRAMLQTVLEAEGFAVEVAGDGLEGLLKVRMRRPAAVILDIMMPDVGGLKVLDELAEEHAALPVIVVTGAHDASQLARARLGDDHVLDKPFAVDELVARVRALTTTPEHR